LAARSWAPFPPLEIDIRSLSRAQGMRELRYLRDKQASDPPGDVVCPYLAFLAFRARLASSPKRRNSSVFFQHTRSSSVPYPVATPRSAREPALQSVLSSCRLLPPIWPATFHSPGSEWLTDRLLSEWNRRSAKVAEKRSVGDLAPPIILPPDGAQ